MAKGQDHDDATTVCVDSPEMFTVVVAGCEGEAKGQRILRQGSAVSSLLSSTIEDLREAGPVLLASLSLVSVLEGADMALLPAVFYALQEDLGLRLGDLAIMNVVQGVTGTLAAPFWGIMADRGIMRRKTIIIQGCILQGIVTMLLAVVDQMVGMTCLRALNGALLASLRPVANGVIADVTCEAKRGKVFGFVQMCTNAGLMAGGLIGTPLSTKTVFGLQGWRVAFIGIGLLSVLVGLFAACTMTEPPQETTGRQAKERGAFRQEAKKLLGYFRMPTFCALIFQGWFGGIPWTAMGFSTLFYQVGGIGDEKAAILAAASQVAGAFGGLLGGLIGDRLARCWPMHGRPLTAQISVMAGVPVAYLTFMVDPPEGNAAFFYYLGLVVFLGLTASWCGVGVNLPILTEIVNPEGRATILAWESTLESTFCIILGNAMVGFLAENVFGYRLADAHEGVADINSRRALGKALTFTCFLPWVICWIAYSLLHWSYPKDLRRVREEKKEVRREEKARQKAAEAEAEKASPKNESPKKVDSEENENAVLQENENAEMECDGNPEEDCPNQDLAIDVCQDDGDKESAAAKALPEVTADKDKPEAVVSI